MGCDAPAAALQALEEPWACGDEVLGPTAREGVEKCSGRTRWFGLGEDVPLRVGFLGEADVS